MRHFFSTQSCFTIYSTNDTILICKLNCLKVMFDYCVFTWFGGLEEIYLDPSFTRYNALFSSPSVSTSYVANGTLVRLQHKDNLLPDQLNFFCASEAKLKKSVKKRIEWRFISIESRGMEIFVEFKKVLKL